MRIPKRIAFFGVSRSGKSTFGAALQQRFGHQPVAFADPLKAAAKVIFGFKDEHLYGASDLRSTQYPDFLFGGHCLTCHVDCLSPTARFLNSKRGSPAPEIREAIEKACEELEDYWRCPKCDTSYPKYVTPRIALQTLGTEWGRMLCQDLWAASCFANMEPGKAYVITDGRFANELRHCSRNDTFTVLLLRGLEGSSSKHPSEAEVRELARTPGYFSVVLDNVESTVEESLEQLLRELCALGAELPDAATCEEIVCPA